MIKIRLLLTILFLAQACFSQLTFTVSSSIGNFSLTCINSVITISATSNFSNSVTYAWTTPQLNTIIANSLNVINPGTYTVTASSGTLVSTQTIVIGTNTIAPTVTLTTSSSSISCLNYSVLLTAIANPTNVLYSWVEPGVGLGCNTYTCVENSTGSYTVNVTNPLNGCSNSGSITIQDGRIYPILGATNLFTISCPSGTVNLIPSLVSSTNGIVFQWNSPANAATSATNNLILNTNAPGTYSFLATHTLSGCSSRAEFLVYACVGLIEENQFSGKVFPNPFENFVYLQNISSEKKDFHVQVLNVFGQIVYEKNFNIAPFELDLSKQISGFYFLNISSGTERLSIRLLKQ